MFLIVQRAGCIDYVILGHDCLIFFIINKMSHFEVIYLLSNYSGVYLHSIVCVTSLHLLCVFIIADINECEIATDNCHLNATCTNNDGGFTCTCDAGFSGNGVSCDGKFVDYCYTKTRQIYTLSLCRQFERWLCESHLRLLYCAQAYPINVAYDDIIGIDLISSFKFVVTLIFYSHQMYTLPLCITNFKGSCHI